MISGRWPKNYPTRWHGQNRDGSEERIGSSAHAHGAVVRLSAGGEGMRTLVGGWKRMHYTILDYHTNRRYVPTIYKLQNITKPIQRFHICLAVLTCCCVVALFVSFCSIDCLSVFLSLLLFMFGFVIPPDLFPPLSSPSSWVSPVYYMTMRIAVHFTRVWG